MDKDIKELHTLLEQSLILIRDLTNKYNGNMDDIDLYNAIDLIKEIEVNI